MSTHNTVGLSLDVNGTLPPAMPHNFNVEFFSVDNTPLSEMNIVSRQIVSVSPQNIGTDKFGFKTGNLELNIEIDNQHLAPQALIKLYEVNFFNMRINYLSGGKPVRTTTYTNCSVERIVESSLDYQGSNRKEQFKVESKYPIMRTDELVEAISKNDTFALIDSVMCLLSKIDLTVTGSNKKSKYDSATLMAYASIRFECVEHSFTNKQTAL